MKMYFVQRNKDGTGGGYLTGTVQTRRQWSKICKRELGPGVLGSTSMHFTIKSKRKAFGTCGKGTT